MNHCINDIWVQGADPLFFLDYIATDSLNPQDAADIVRGMAEACSAAGIALIGGETAEMPGTYREGHYDVAGFIVGAVERWDLIDGTGIRAGDVLVGLPSTGLHTNGYSLARRVFDLDDHPENLDERPPELGGETVAEALLAVHRSYYQGTETDAATCSRARAHHGRRLLRRTCRASCRITCRLSLTAARGLCRPSFGSSAVAVKSH